MTTTRSLAFTLCMIAIALAGCVAEPLERDGVLIGDLRDCEHGEALDCCGDTVCRPDRGAEPPCPIACFDDECEFGEALDCCGDIVCRPDRGAEPPCPIACIDDAADTADEASGETAEEAGEEATAETAERCEFGEALDCCGDTVCRPDRGAEPPCPIACFDKCEFGEAIDCCGDTVCRPDRDAEPPCPIACF